MESSSSGHCRFVSSWDGIGLRAADLVNDVKYNRQQCQNKAETDLLAQRHVKRPGMGLLPIQHVKKPVEEVSDCHAQR